MPVIFFTNFTGIMQITNRRTRFYLLSFFKHDFKASISVFFFALPLCLGVSLASNAPVYSGIIAGIIPAIRASGLDPVEAIRN